MNDEDTSPAARAGSGLGRRTLLLGAAGASAVVSIRPALANTAASVSLCEIPVPDPGRAGRYIADNGDVVPAGTPGAQPAAQRPFRAADVKRTLQSGVNLPGTTHDQSRAYTNYIRRLQSGTSGFTCFASLQMPRG
ncbi:hypothetical protein LK533_02260 [Sphingomonas sp. PL-96]|uniref:hypothetical protein n=1 Tax=Sphingomonas sp. PL-96 TaxID=2887201 RepID=UPI001E64C2C9|nr:hypothetical protein [Sphingomonas sp. PL-96]MCC2975496.1 hypothetical protein [Sphingomonas sp. PL-96]